MQGPVAEGLAGRTVLVVGAHGALGSVLCKRLGEAGVTVVLLGRRLPKLNRLYDALVASGAPTPAIYPLDLEGAGPSDYDQLAAAIEQGCGGLDGIVHVVAEFKGLMAVDSTPAEDWIRSLHVNLTAPVLLTQACLPLLRKSSRADVLVALDDPERVERAFWGGYALAQAGRAAWVRSLGDELENSAVRVTGFRLPPMRSPLRTRAFFTEDAAHLATPEQLAPSVLALMQQVDRPTGQVMALEPERRAA
ncbi:MAG: SDR family NAD(P)-dependent oxidoreductase [Xanthomonadales bacterium]|nr:SDR family NAD(P)-dependent oxidoreductase [Xanthomonadales bacterium]